MDPDPNEPTAPQPFALTFSQILSLSLDMRGRIEAEWQRLVAAHAALIAAMVFFASRAEPFITARIVVFVFYSATVMISILNLRQAYSGLRIVTGELNRFDRTGVGAPVIDWMLRHDFRADRWLRTTMPILVWMLVFYLMILPLFLGRVHTLP